MNHIQGNNRNQIRMISLEQMVEPESMVRIIDAFVDMLDLKQFGFNYFTLNKEGRPPYHPATLMKLYLYGYQNSVRTCRKLEKACKTNIEIMHTNGKWYNKNLNNGRKSYRVMHYKTKACNGCHLRVQCTSNKYGRLIERSEFQQYITKNNDRVNQNQDYYRQRQQITTDKDNRLLQTKTTDY